MNFEELLLPKNPSDNLFRKLVDNIKISTGSGAEYSRTSIPITDIVLDQDKREQLLSVYKEAITELAKFFISNISISQEQHDQAINSFVSETMDILMQLLNNEHPYSKYLLSRDIDNIPDDECFINETFVEILLVRRVDSDQIYSIFPLPGVLRKDNDNIYYPFNGVNKL